MGLHRDSRRILVGTPGTYDARNKTHLKARVMGFGRQFEKGKRCYNVWCCRTYRMDCRAPSRPHRYRSTISVCCIQDIGSETCAP